MTKATEILLEARNLIEKGWCQGCMARRAGGGLTDIFDASAAQFCLMGAMHRAGAMLESDEFRPTAQNFIYKAGNIGSLIHFNDAKGRTQAEIIDVLTRAIEASRETGE